MTYKTKNITVTRYYFIFLVLGKKEKNKLKQSEIEVKMIIKVKKHNLCGNWQMVQPNPVPPFTPQNFARFYFYELKKIVLK